VYDSNDPSVVTFAKECSEKSVVLTFDDGPSRVVTDILDVLLKESVPAVFFWQSRLLFSERPWKRVLNEGHQIGTHSTKHLNFQNLSYDEQYKDLYNSVKKIEDITGIRVKHFRPPFGQYNEDTIIAAEKLKLKTVMWRISSMDWELKEKPEQIVSNITDNLEDGAIILLHELHQTVSVLPLIIKEIKRKGFTFSLLP
jgi:peptidoglycan/xylan/chitin deacetylase (PgdA/CDA1 family)